ncbi:ZBED1 protein, partial [Polyodon spathula]|nr:ZBED1 protein [Polyodon spathula]
MENKGSEGSSADLKLVAHPRAKSKVWRYFGFDTDAEGCILQWKKIYCRICLAQIAYSGNTSNLSYHLEKNHPDEFCEFVKSNTEQMREAFATAFSKLKPESSQHFVQDTLNMKPNYAYENRKHQDLSAAIVSFICEGMYPVSVVDEPTFRALLRTADPRYELPSRNYLSTKAIPEKYYLVKEAVFKELADMVWCGISADLWKSQNQNRTYVSLAAHFINNCIVNNATLTTRCLKTFEVPEDNTAENITRRCRKLVEYFQQSTVAMYMLKEKQKQQGIPQCMLISDRVTWWVSTLAMLQRLKEQQFVISSVLVEDSNNHHLMLEAMEWSTVEGLVDLLQPFKQAADMITACKYPAISMVKPLLHMLLNTTLKAKDSDLKEISTAKEVIAKELFSTYQQTPEVDMFLNVATFIDPRYKKLPFLSPFERAQVETRVIDEAKALLEKWKESSRPEDLPFSDEPPFKRQATSTPPPTSNASNMLSVIFSQTGADENQEELHAQVMEELSNFKSQKVLGLNEDPLRWWSDRLALFPILPKLLQKYWCVPATSMYPERLFSSSGNVLRGKRNRLAPAHVDQQVFLYENTRTGCEAEPVDEDEGEWGLEHDQALSVGDTLAMRTNVINTKDTGFY